MNSENVVISNIAKNDAYEKQDHEVSDSFFVRNFYKVMTTLIVLLLIALVYLNGMEIHQNNAFIK
jgi:hypothetical protein